MTQGHGHYEHFVTKTLPTPVSNIYDEYMRHDHLARVFTYESLAMNPWPMFLLNSES